MKKLIIGLGTGRCGTHSLNKLLDSQKGVISLHEPLKHLPTWEFSIEIYNLIKKEIDILFKKYSTVSIVAFNYLPYVTRLMQDYSTSVVILKRERRDTVESYFKWAGKGNRNFWQNHDSIKWNPCVWDRCYPNYDNMTMKEAIGQYWDDYYYICDLITKENENANIFPTKFLNTAKGVNKILDACGITNKNIKTGIQLSVQKY